MRGLIEKKREKLQAKIDKIIQEKINPILNEIALLDKMLATVDGHGEKIEPYLPRPSLSDSVSSQENDLNVPKFLKK